MHRYLNRRRRAEAHHLGDDVASLEGNSHIGQGLVQVVPQPFLQILCDGWRIGLQRDAKNRLVLAACKQINRIDRVVRCLNADKIGRDVDVFRPDNVLDDIHRFGGDHFRALEPRPGRGAQADLNLPRLHLRKDFRADPREKDDNHEAGRKQITAEQQPPDPQHRFEPLHPLIVSSLDLRVREIRVPVPRHRGASMPPGE